ncbi:MAG: putative lipid II flippase FtsW [Gemmatimonadota bacterium]|jgi:cell division protein FtsW
MTAHAVRSGVSASLERTAPVSRLGRGWEGTVLFLIAMALLSFGLVMVYSASAVMAQGMGLPGHYFVVRQAMGGAVGLVVLAVVAQMDYRRFRRLAWPLLGIVILSLMVVVLPGVGRLAPTVNGARRWLVVGPVRVQPSEAAKFALIVWTAALAVKKQDELHSLTRGLLPFLLVWGLVAGLIMLEPNMSTALFTVMLAALVVYAAGARIGHFLVLAVLGFPLVWTQVSQVGYRFRRLAAFMDPAKDPAGMSYQINQALIALGSGGVLGRGFGQGQQKFGFLPEPHNDFILAMIGEEWGVLGLVFIVTLFVAFALVGYRVARQAPDLFGSLLAAGATNLVVIQALLHMAVNLALVPTTGITLPLVSYGRSSLIISLAAVGVVISVARVSDRRRRAGGAA